MPGPGGATLMDQAKQERLSYLQAHTRESLLFQAGLEKATMAGAGSSTDFHQLGKALQPSAPWRAQVSGASSSGQACPTQPNLQQTYKVPPAPYPAVVIAKSFLPPPPPPTAPYPYPPPPTATPCHQMSGQSCPVVAKPTCISAPPARMQEGPPPQDRIVSSKPQPPSPSNIGQAVGGGG